MTLTETDDSDNLENHAIIWREAKEQGIILVPFAGDNGIITAAVRTEDVEEACRRMSLDSNNWNDINSLGFGFFVNAGAPGYGDTREESYLSALAAFEELQPRARWRDQDDAE